MAARPSFHEAFWFWLKLGFISFGGPAGQIAIMHQFLVNEKKWISESRFLHALNYCMVLPGPEAQQLATYTGWLLHGTKGGMVAGAFFVLPSMIILLVLSILYTSFGSIPWVYALFDGLKPAVIAIVILALIKIGRKSLHTWFHGLVAAMAFVSIFFFNIAFPWIIVTAVALALGTQKIAPGFFRSSAGDGQQVGHREDGYFINQHSQVAGVGFNSLRLMKQTVVALLFWLFPMGAIFFVGNQFSFWNELILFFTKAAFVTFGGAYAVLPYVAQVSVEKLRWLSELQMIDGLALGETTPGPLVMVLSFVGFMAAYNHFGQSLWMGCWGLVITTFYTFIPCFLFIFAGAPIIEKTRENPEVKKVLSIVTAAVVGVILKLTIYLGQAVVFPAGIASADYLALGWVVISFLAMYRLKVGMIPWIGMSALFGLVRFWFL